MSAKNIAPVTGAGSGIGKGCATFMAMARLPLSANVLFMTVMATKMPGRPVEA